MYVNKEIYNVCKNKKHYDETSGGDRAIALNSFPDVLFLINRIIMSNDDLLQIAACARRILSVVGPPSPPECALSVRVTTLELPKVQLLDLLEQNEHDCLDRTTREAVSAVLAKHLSSNRNILRERFLATTRELRSPSRFGLPDSDVEAYTVRMFETIYTRQIQRIKRMLRSLVRAREVNASAIGKGGFGDVSSPS